MAGLETQFSGAGSDRFANCATRIKLYRSCSCTQRRTTASQHSDRKTTPSWCPVISTIDLLRLKICSTIFDRMFEFELFRSSEGRTIRRSRSSSREPFLLARFRSRNRIEFRSETSRWESDLDRRRSQFRLQVVKTPKRVVRIVRIGKRWRWCCCSCCCCGGRRCCCCCCCCWCCCDGDRGSSFHDLSWKRKKILIGNKKVKIRLCN